MHDRARHWLQQITALPLAAPVRIMNVCGGHERAIALAGLRSLLPPAVQLIPGPGCPVCICPEEDIRQAIDWALHHEVIVASFGDMLRVPVNLPRGEVNSLTAAKAAGADVRAIAAPTEAIRIASENPARTVVLHAVGFETTMAPIAALIGQGPEAVNAITPKLPAVAPLALPANLPAELLGHRADVVAARWRVESSVSSLASTRALFYPNINLVAFLGVQSFGLNMLDKSGSSVGSIGPAISLPIFTGGRLQGELRASVANYDEAVANYHRALTQALQEVASTGLSQQALAEQLVKGREAVAAASEAHRVARNRYEGGLANHLEVLYAEDGLLNSQRQLALLQSRAFMLDVALKRALGGGYEQH